MHIKKHSSLIVIWLLICIVQQYSFAQCTTPISSFPYKEDFETSDGNFVRSATTHWEWGSIGSKPVITTAGSGSKCWIAGGLSGSFYNSGSSYLQSPCFNISSLVNPQIRFKIFWETERRYDGVNLQFTLDGGTVWQTLGAANSDNGCTIQNWFNYSPINILGTPGWSGNIQATSGSCQGTGGSGQWLTAVHSLSSITGSASVIFRFNFAAGTTCNDYDGLAIDDFQIQETPPNSADFTYTCSANNTVSFVGTGDGCKSGVLWNFGDIASGAANNSTLDNPQHIFSSPGNYTITATTSFLSGPPITINKNITVVGLTATITSQIKCNGDQTGAITVNATPTGVYNYLWDTNPAQNTASITNLFAGTYTIFVTGNNTCDVSMPVIIDQPAALNLNVKIADAKCGSVNGSISTDVTGGVLPYNYIWSNASTTTLISNLAPDSYSLMLTDGNGCIKLSGNLLVKNIVVPVIVSLGKDTSLCPGEKLTLNPGKFRSYKWQDNSTSTIYPVTQSGVYTVLVTDTSGCTGSASIKVMVDDCSEVYFPSGFTPNADRINNFFGPLPPNILSSLKNYKLTVYGRWGEVIFNTTDPYKKWDGSFKGVPLGQQAFIWIATYKQNNLLPVTQKGMVSILR